MRHAPMPAIKLTEKAIAKLAVPERGQQVLYWDAEVKGFGILVSGATAKRTYVVQRSINGRTRRVTVGPANVLSLDQARKRAEEILADFYRGIDPKAARASKVNLKEARDDYLRARKDLRPRSAANYRDGIERYLSDWLDSPPTSISPDMVERRHAEIAREIEERHRKSAADAAKKNAAEADRAENLGLVDAAAKHREMAAKAEKRQPFKGQAVANATMRAVRMLWNHVADRIAIGENPVRLRKQWFAVPRRERMVKADEMAKFYRAVLDLPSPIYRDYVLALLFTGLRRREAANLRWSDVDFAAKVIRIPAKEMKAGKKLDLPMTTFIHELMVARRSMGKTEFVFLADSKSGHIEEVKHFFDLIAVKTGIEVSPHDLRRTFCTVAESCEISPMALKALVAHAHGGDVTAGYVQMTAERLRRPAQQVCDRLMELCRVEQIGDANVKKIRG
jgi:integrase